MKDDTKLSREKKMKASSQREAPTLFYSPGFNEKHIYLRTYNGCSIITAVAIR